MRGNEGSAVRLGLENVGWKNFNLGFFQYSINIALDKKNIYCGGFLNWSLD